jgi:hypothetical protein
MNIQAKKSRFSYYDEVIERLVAKIEPSLFMDGSSKRFSALLSNYHKLYCKQVVLPDCKVCQHDELIFAHVVFV